MPSRGIFTLNGSRGEAAAVAEGLEPELVDRPAALLPGALGGLQHPDGAADIELASGRQPGDLRLEIDAVALLVDEDVQPVADPLPQLVGEGQVLPAPAGIEQPEIRPRPRARASAMVKIGVMPMPPASRRYSGRPRLRSK